MKIYRINEGKLLETEITGESDRFYNIAPCEDFYNRKEVLKVKSCITPKSAIDEEIRLSEIEIDYFESRLAQQKLRLSNVIKLREAL